MRLNETQEAQVRIELIYIRVDHCNLCGGCHSVSIGAGLLPSGTSYSCSGSPKQNNSGRGAALWVGNVLITINDHIRPDQDSSSVSYDMTTPVYVSARNRAFWRLELEAERCLHTIYGMQRRSKFPIMKKAPMRTRWEFGR